MRLLRMLLLVMMSASAPAMAQTPPNPVMEHYRAYRAALESGDLPAASNEAEQALAASETRDGDGGRTAVLALNLASVRLMNHEAAGALAPAQRALALSQNAESGVDARMAGLVLGRSELSIMSQSGVERLSTILHGSLGGLPENEVYAAAMDLGGATTQDIDSGVAQFAFSVAVAHAAGSPFGREYGYGVARTGEAVAQYLHMLGPTGQRTMRWTDTVELEHAFEDAVATLQPLTVWTTETPTLGERAYANALIWQASFDRKLSWDSDFVSRRTNEFGDAVQRAGPIYGSQRECAARIRRVAMNVEREQFRTAVAVLRLRADDAGEISDRLVLEFRGPTSYRQAIESAWSEWRLERIPDAPDGCPLAGTYLATIYFTDN